jgi:hypothetical protein
MKVTRLEKISNKNKIIHMNIIKFNWKIIIINTTMIRMKKKN